MEKRLFELLLPNTTLEEIEFNLNKIAKYYMNELITREDDNCMIYANNFCYEEDIYPMEIDGEKTWQLDEISYDYDEYNNFLKENKESFYSWLEYELKYKMENFIEDIKYSLNNNKLTLYRGMSVEESFLTKINQEQTNLGVCWSLDKEVTNEFSFSSENSKSLLMISEIDINEINLLDTMRLHLHPSLEEKELRVQSFGKIKLKEIYYDNKKIDINDKLLNKTFKGENNSDLLDVLIKNKKEYQEGIIKKSIAMENIQSYIPVERFDEINTIIEKLKTHKNEFLKTQTKIIINDNKLKIK